MRTKVRLSACKLRKILNRTGYVQNKEEIIDYMRLVAEFITRNAQDAVIRAPPILEKLKRVLGCSIQSLNVGYSHLPL